MILCNIQYDFYHFCEDTSEDTYIWLLISAPLFVEQVCATVCTARPNLAASAEISSLHSNLLVPLLQHPSFSLSTQLYLSRSFTSPGFNLPWCLPSERYPWHPTVHVSEHLIHIMPISLTCWQHLAVAITKSKNCSVCTQQADKSRDEL